MPISTRRLPRRLLLAATFLITTGPAWAQPLRDPNAPPPPPPPAVATQPTKAAPDMPPVLDQLQALGAGPFEQPTQAQPRAQPSAADAVKVVMVRRGMATASNSAVTTRDMPYGSHPEQFVRVSRPAASASNTPLPVILYWHGGGGWVVIDVNVYDSTPRMLSEMPNAAVVSVQYRLPPEDKFPSQHEAAISAYRYVFARRDSANVIEMATLAEDMEDVS